VQVTVSYPCKTSSSFAVPVAVSSPAISSQNGTGAGQAPALNGDGSLNDAAHPVKIGGYVSLYATGEGHTTPAGTDGKIAPVMQPLPQAALPVKVDIDGHPAAVTYAGAAPAGLAGDGAVGIAVSDN
jgi:uncharacterized protein (TIGR03437 family)